MAVANMQSGGSMGGGDDGLRPPSDPPARALVRGVSVAALGGVTSFLLFWGMQALVTVTGELDDPGQKLSIEFVRLKKDTTPEPKEREKPKRQKPEQQPPPPEMNVAKNINPGEAVGDMVPMIDTGVELAEATSLAAGGADRSPVPLVQVDPEFPERAKAQRLEGWVTVEFTITPVGTVADARVVASKPTYVFDRAALQAVRRWKYNPQIQDGEPIARRGVRTTFQFKLPKGSR